jgi:hypothetical protein
MSVFTKHNDTLLRRAGSIWHATINGGALSFSGLFSIETAIVNDPGSNAQVLTTVTSITADTEIANTLTVDTPLTDQHGRAWRVRAVEPIDDGSLSKVHIVC